MCLNVGMLDFGTITYMMMYLTMNKGAANPL